MNPWQKYVIPESLADALHALSLASGSGVPVAGGTDLLLDLEQGRHAPAETLVDLTRVAELTVIETRGDRLFIGAAVPLSRVAGDSLVRRHAQAVAEASLLIGGPQVRNVATLGGNVAHALPAGDGTIALLALDATAEVGSLAGTRVVPLADLFVGPGKSALRPQEELLTGFLIPCKETGQSSGFKRIMRPQGVALPILNVAVWLARSGDVIAAVRIAVGPGGSIPWRAREAEKVLTGRPFSDANTGLATEALLEHVEFRSSARRGSAEYRRHLVKSLFAETLAAAWARVMEKAGNHATA